MVGNSFLIEMPSTLKARLSEYSKGLSTDNPNAWSSGHFIIFTFDLDFVIVREKVKDEFKANLALVF